MKLLEKILLATDFSATSDYVVENAIVLAKIFQSKITLIHVLPDDINNEKAKELLDKAATNQLRLINEHINNEGVKTSNPIIEYGSYSEKVVLASKNKNVNLILVGAGEKSINDTFQLGTTAETIIRKSNKPVWVVKKDNNLNIKTIICPVDFSDESSRSLKNAITMARRLQAKLLVFSVYSLLNRTSVKLNWDDINKLRKSEHLIELDKFLVDFNFTDLNWSKEVKGGSPAIEILKATKKHNSDLLIMGTSGKTGLSRMIMGSVTEKVIREVPCSFITLKSEDFINLKLITRIRDIEKHYDVANQLMKDGFFDESINEFEICLNINDMHIPSLNGMSKVYEKLGNTNNSEKYKNMVKVVLSSIWDRKVEDDIRKHYKL
ncbi:MAG TPA: hypothetical protein DDZ39_01185 [Flavobacteriaceae bacterium]|jgi:nucleotide-binding universal stress UspA family protein|nr:hypothetical protein [Flavobacteriaceae bacterium]